MRLKKGRSFVIRCRISLGLYYIEESFVRNFCLSLRRLNFEHLPAEKSSMNRVDSFFVLIIVLLSGLTIVYNSAQYDLGNIQLQQAENKYLRNQMKLMELKEREFELRFAKKEASFGRRMASVPGPELDPGKLAQGLYHEVVEQCIDRKKDLICLDKVDSVVTQFPDSKWAGKSLVVLASRYIQEKRYEQATDLVKIVRTEFKDEKEVLNQLKEIEKNPL